MTTNRTAGLLLGVVLLCASCSEVREEGSRSGVVEATKSPTDDSDATRAKDKKRGSREDGGKKQRQGQSDVAQNGSRKGDSTRGNRPAKKRGGGGAGSTADAAAYPAAGDYNYRQSGYEEFCQATCQRQDLPKQQPVSTKLKNRSADSAVVVNEARESDNRVVRTTMKFTSDKALITEVFTRFKQGNFSFQDTYRPKPPVESLRFPLDTGAAWSGSWKDKTSGDYSIKILGREQVMAAGTSIDAFRIRTETTFRGQFDGRSQVVLWFDPDTKAVVKADGMIDVNSTFGRYRSDFQRVLSSGPGY
jgi:hypothetical protein